VINAGVGVLHFIGWPRKWHTNIRPFDFDTLLRIERRAVREAVAAQLIIMPEK
jgi:hypothetical protein